MLDNVKINQINIHPESFRVVKRKSLRKRAFAKWAIGIAVILFFTAIAMVFLPIGWVALVGLLAMLSWVVLRHKTMNVPGGFPVLTYHSISEDAEWLPWAAETSVLPKTLRNNLKSLNKMGMKVISSQEMIALRNKGKRLPANGIVLHFDDGYLDNWVAAEPILKEFGATGTMFISMDFIDNSSGLRPQILDRDQHIKWDGYANWDEIKSMDSGAVFDVQPHGTNHGRVFTSDQAIDIIDHENWRKYAFVQWQKMPKDKSQWYSYKTPPVIPVGTPIGESAPSFRSKAIRETEAAYEARVRSELMECVDTFQRMLGKKPNVFCWPQNSTSFTSRKIAAELGFKATTGGKGRNSFGESPQVISRVHAGERVAGFTWFFADDLVFRANVRCFQGNYYWVPVVLIFAVIKKMVLKIRRRLNI